MLNSRLGNTLLDSNYQIRGLTVKNQQLTELCWAFSFSSVLEGSGNKNIYSPAYLDYTASRIYNKNQGNSGNFYLALGSSTSGKYPVLETNMPFDSVYNETENSSSTYYLTPIEDFAEGILDKRIDARITDATFFANIYKSIDSNNNIIYTDGNQYTYTTNEVEAVRTLVKEHIKNKGPISAQMYSDLVMDQERNLISQENCYNVATGASFCKNSTKSANHAVTIVGWDDNYEVSNFNSDNSPTNPGAYIALNSYGEDIGKNGYIYVSYEDIFIEQSMNGIDELEEYESEEDIAYDNIYQYDELGYSYQIGLTTGSAMAANVFSFDKATSNQGESFISVDEGENWTDIYNLKVSDSITLKNTNACIKAYTIETSSSNQEDIKVTGVELNKTTSTLQVGQT